MKGQFWLAVNIKLKWIFHVHPADVFAFVRNCSWEHHNLSLTRSSHENFLDLSTHVYIMIDIKKLKKTKTNILHYLPVSSSILSHSSRTNICNLSKFKSPFWQSARILPGVPMMICGALTPLIILAWSWYGCPPKNTSFLKLGRYFVNLSNSFLI